MLEEYELGNPTHDLLLVELWSRMANSGDLERVFTSDCFSLSGFLRAFQPPAVLLFVSDEEGIWFALWGEPVMTAGAFGFWIREDKRDPKPGETHLGLRPSYQAIDKMLDLWPVLFQVTKDPHIVELAQRLGAVYMGVVPHMFDGEPAHITYLTREAFREHAKTTEYLDNG